MSSIINKIKAKTTSKTSDDDKKSSEPQFSIQPHPAKTNDPADLQRDNLKQPGGGLQTSDPAAPFHARDPHVPSAEIRNNLEAPLGRDQLRSQAEQLNK